jgi:UDP-2,4-diacetamido-2,4,6-trideoxy-beta-L-altropyranose hydrolase
MVNNMRIVFRVDSSAQMGSGHLMRCLTLANALRRRGAVIFFVSRLHKGNLIEKLEMEGYCVHKLSMSLDTSDYLKDYETWLGASLAQDIDETLNVLGDECFDWLIVDHYSLGKTWEQAVRVVTDKIMVIDDLADREHDCDILLDQNYFGLGTERRYVSWISASTRTLLGPHFALLQPEYAKLHLSVMPTDGVVRRILVFFGNSDSNNQTNKVLKALSSPELSHILVDVVVGSNHPAPLALEQQAAMRREVFLHYDCPTLAELMMQSDFVIGAGGATTWERMCLGKPSLVISIADNQRELSQHLALDGYHVLLENTEGITSETWLQAITRLIKAPSDIEKMAKKSSQLVDGLGLNRVVELIENEQMDLNIRYANARDKELLFRWANDKSVRKQSFRQALVEASEHKKWFEEKLLDPHSFIFIADSASGSPLGQVRFDLDVSVKEALIDISIDSRMRGKGLGVKVLFKAMERCASVIPDLKFVAEVREENLASQKLFKRMNFNQVTSDLPSAVRFEFQNDVSIVFESTEMI